MFITPWADGDPDRARTGDDTLSRVSRSDGKDAHVGPAGQLGRRSQRAKLACATQHHNSSVLPCLDLHGHGAIAVDDVSISLDERNLFH